MKIFGRTGSGKSAQQEEIDQRTADTDRALADKREREQKEQRRQAAAEREREAMAKEGREIQRQRDEKKLVD